MEATREQMKEEAVKRMKMLGINPPTIEEFEQEGKLNVSRGGFLYWLDDEYRAKVAEFEEKYGGLAFAVIESNTEFGKLLSILYVSTHRDEWESDRLGLKAGEPFAYVFNLDVEECSEFGFINVRKRFGGLVRTA